MSYYPDPGRGCGILLLVVIVGALVACAGMLAYLLTVLR